MQAFVAYFIVAIAALYAAWLLMPQGLRRRLINRLGRIAPSKRAWLERGSADGAGTGCSTCKGCEEESGRSAPPGEAKIEIHRR
jgi:hypothetical protein